MRKNNLVIIGFRASGKSVIGKALAAHWKLPFVDLDQAIEFIIGESIESFVNKHGWQVFRDVEQRVTHDFCRNFSGIISTGGGTIENSKNLQNLKKTGVFLWLNTDFGVMRKHLLKDTSRPRLNPGISLAQEIDQMWQQRRDIYRATADLEVTHDFQQTVNQAAKKIAAHIPDNVLPESLNAKKILMLSSERGTVLHQLLDLQKNGRLPNVTWQLIVSQNNDSPSLSIAKKNNIPTETFPADLATADADRWLINIVRQHQPDAILLSGWHKILGDSYCHAFGNITYNVHPSLLPKFAGLKSPDIYTAILESGDRYTGCSVHRIVPKVDSGEVVVQRKILVEPEDSADQLKTKVQKQESLGFCELLESRRY